MKSLIHLYWPIVLLVIIFNPVAKAQNSNFDMPVGYSIDINKITDAKISYAKSLGISYIELAGIGSMLDKSLSITEGEDYWIRKVDSIKHILEENQMHVWSIHMPFSKFIDISLIEEESRQYVVQTHLKLTRILARLNPHIILFHPSFYLEKNARAHRYAQLTKSVHELYKGIKRYKVEMAVENMLGASLEIGQRERPLMRTVEEYQLLFKTFPKQVGLAVDMCHIAQSEKLIEAFGRRVKTLHVSDGDGTSESHYLPCNNLGKNKWNLIFSALEKINYRGVFMYECKYSDEKELTSCYDTLKGNYANYKRNN